MIDPAFPKQQLATVVETIYSATGMALASRARLRRFRHFEHATEATVIHVLTVRYVEALRPLALDGPEALPAAFALSRSSLESSTRGLWLLAPDDPWRREERWLALQKEAASHRKELPPHLVNQLTDVDPRNHKALVAQVEQMLGERLIGQGQEPAIFEHPISLARMMQSLEQKKTHYRDYVWLSQWTHGTSAASRLYLRGLGTGAELGEFITIGQWLTTMRIAFGALDRLTLRLIEVLGDETDARATPDYLPQIQREALRNLLTDPGSEALAASNLPPATRRRSGEA